jgi:hypothetical protein
MGLLWMTLADKMFLGNCLFLNYLPNKPLNTWMLLCGFSLKTYYIVNGVSKLDIEMIKI